MKFEIVDSLLALSDAEPDLRFEMLEWVRGDSDPEYIIHAFSSFLHHTSISQQTRLKHNCMCSYADHT